GQVAEGLATHLLQLIQWLRANNDQTHPIRRVVTLDKVHRGPMQLLLGDPAQALAVTGGELTERVIRGGDSGQRLTVAPDRFFTNQGKLLIEDFDFARQCLGGKAWLPQQLTEPL